MKGKVSTAAIGIGIGVALCNPVTGAVITGAGIAGAAHKIADLTPPPRLEQ